MLPAVWIKVILLVTLFFSTLILSLIPLKLNSYLRKPGVSRYRKKTVKAALSLMSCFSAGVFIATCLLDLFPGVQGKITDGFINLELENSFPLGEFILVFGFFLIFIVEQIMLTVKESNPDSALTPLLDGMDSLSVGSSYQESRNSAMYGAVATDPANVGSEDNEAANIDELEEDKVQYVDPSSQSVVRSLMLLCALSLHSFFEGMAIGLQEGTSDVLEIFLPVALHKSIIAFALGLNLAQSKLHVKSIIRSDVLFAITSPIGIGIGTAIAMASSGNPHTAMINGVLEGIACGTFLFVVFFEILPHEFMRKRKFPHRLLKTLFLILGFSVVTFILFIHPEERPICAKLVKPDH